MEALLEEGVGKPPFGEQWDRMLFDCTLVNGIKPELAPEKEQTLCAEKLYKGEPNWRALVIEQDSELKHYLRQDPLLHWRSQSSSRAPELPA